MISFLDQTVLIRGEYTAGFFAGLRAVLSPRARVTRNEGLPERRKSEEKLDDHYEKADRNDGQELNDCCYCY